MRIERDGNVVRYFFRQSGFKDFQMCPDKARLKWFHGLVDSDTDATVLGTALHTYVEQRLVGESPATAGGFAETWLRGRLEDTVDPVRRVQIKGDGTLLAYLDALMGAFESDIWPQLAPMESLEQSFRVRLGIYNTADADGTVTVREIWLEGTWDALDIEGVLIDWKTASRDEQYEQWEIDRFHPQPTFYTAALVALSGDDPLTSDQTRDWLYAVHLKGRTSRAFTKSTTRHRGHWNMLFVQLQRIAAMCESMGQDVPWPLNDQGWHCSAKWCVRWDSCKGSHMAGTPTAVAIGA